MRYISICSGIEAATVAWQPLGWEAVAFAEIEPFPCAVLAHHYPDVPNLGDISKVDWSKYAGTIDVLVGGTPCQSFSIAGRREGMDGASGLVEEYFRCLSECKPRWFLWENVPGAFSSNEGRDFEFILREWHKRGYHVSFRVLNAEYFGVPQHRRRIFAVGHSSDWRCAAKVLFERFSLSRHPAPSRKTRQANTSYAERNAGKTSTLVFKDREGKPGGGKGILIGVDKAFTLSCNQDQFLFSNGVVRRLTPVECERLQGFPDCWTDIPFKGKPAPDGVRYKALGNSMCVNVMRWIGERIQMVEDGKL